MIIPQNQWKTNSCRQTQYFRECPYFHTSWAERNTSFWVTYKKITLMNSTEIIISFRIKFGPFKNRSTSFSFSHFFSRRTEQIWLYLENDLMYFIQKLEDKLTLKSSFNEQKYFFLTFNMKKCRVIFVVGNFLFKN